MLTLTSCPANSNLFFLSFMQILQFGKLAFFRKCCLEQHTNDVIGLWLGDLFWKAMWDVDLELCLLYHFKGLIMPVLSLSPSPPPRLQISIVSTDDDLSWSSWVLFFCFLRQPAAFSGASSFLCQRLSVATAAALTVRPHAFWSALCHYLWRGWHQQMLFIMWILQWIMCHNCFHSVKYSGFFFFSLSLFWGRRRLPVPPDAIFSQEMRETQRISVFGNLEITQRTVFF